MTTKLIVLRGPSGSGKSSVAKELRNRLPSPVALIEQDYIRRAILQEKDIPNGLNIELIKHTVLFALKNSYHVVLEGIFDRGRYEKMFREIVAAHPDENYFFYFDIPFEETLRRHETRANKNEFGENEMRSWYKEKDFLGFAPENLISKDSIFEEIVDRIFRLTLNQ